MKKSPRSSLYILPTLTLALTAFLANPAEAKLPKSLLFPSFSEKSEREVFHRLKDYTNAKGESLGTFHRGQTPNLWSQLDSIDDQIEGTSTAKAFKDSRLSKTGKEIIVAVIDSGVDIHHEDLKGKIWINAIEANGKAGVDDDRNGYIDDIHGWNFLGNAKGEHINGTTLELTREYGRLKKKNEQSGLNPQEKIYFNRISTQFKEELMEAQEDLRSYQELMTAIQLLKSMGLKEETVAAVQAIRSTDPEVLNAKRLAAWVFGNPRIGNSAALQEIINDASVKVLYQYNPEFDSSSIVGDNPTKLDEVGYGNNDVNGPDSVHGTHVAGIIAANRENGIGILGQSDLVKIMAIRAVPNGDERDKDVANAIYYAVKNGAKVINMSFGKEFSPDKAYVDQAVEFAEKNGVILVHAAGNSGKNTESASNNFPNKRIHFGNPSEREVGNWIEVGASSKLKGSKLPASFSNYGKTSVDLFAPGTSILSTVPGGGYRELQGTSMAAPQVAGIAALLMSRFETKASTEIVKTLMNTTTQYPSLVVNLPGSGGSSQVSFSDLSRSGGIINTYQALKTLKP